MSIWTSNQTHTYVCPIYAKDKKSEPENDRPVSHTTTDYMTQLVKHGVRLKLSGKPITEILIHHQVAKT